MSHQILITGGAGFIGGHLARSLVEQGNFVRVIDNLSTGRKSNIADLLDHPHFEFVESDAADESVLRPLCADVDQAYHLAATVGVALVAADPIQTIETNINLTQTLLKVLTEQNRRKPLRLYFASTSEVYGRNPARIWSEDDELVFGPTTIGRWSYGLSKAIDEHLVLSCVRKYKLSAVVGRFFNVIGPRQTGRYGMVLPRFVRAACANEPLVVYDDGSQQRCFIHVLDVVEIIQRLMSADAAVGQVVNIGSNESLSILELAQKVIARTGSRSEIRFQPSRDVYGSDFEDCRWRTPDLTKLAGLIDYCRRYNLDDAIDQCRAELKNGKDDNGSAISL